MEAKVLLHYSVGYERVGQYRLERTAKPGGDCVKYSWPVILTSASGSGKFALVSLLAQLCGRQLAVLSLTHSTDAMVLFGGFEQTDSIRSQAGLRDRVLAWARLSAVAKLAGHCSSCYSTSCR